MAELWEEPADLARRDLFYGPWGAQNAPSATATFIWQAKKQGGTNPGMVVVDPAGREWHVKEGKEARPEVVVSRILSAVGYHQPPVYYLPSFRVATSHVKLKDGGRFRLTLKQLKHDGDWSWDENPFVGTAPHEGLLVILTLLNSADLKNVNNAFYTVRGLGDVTQWFVVRDVGTSLGQTRRLYPDADSLKAFQHTPFITGVSDGHVKFEYHSIHHELLDRITPADVRWACALLARLSDRQWLDAFRAGGYTSTEAMPFVARIHEKIQEGLHVHY